MPVAAAAEDETRGKPVHPPPDARLAEAIGVAEIEQVGVLDLRPEELQLSEAIDVRGRGGDDLQLFRLRGPREELAAKPEVTPRRVLADVAPAARTDDSGGHDPTGPGEAG